MTSEEIRALIEAGFENQRVWMEKMLKSEVNAQLASHLSLLPDLLVDRIATEHNKGAHGKFKLMDGTRPGGLLAAPKGDDDNWQNAKECFELKNPVDTTDNKAKSQEASQEQAKPPPSPKVDIKKAPVPPDQGGALHDFKTNVLGCDESGEGGCSKGPDECFQHFVAGPIFSLISSTVILVNTFYIGFETQKSFNNQVKRLSNETTASMSEGGEYFFTIFFMVELSMRVIAQKRQFIFGVDRFWNFFDSFLIVISLISLVAENGPNLSVFRVFRIFRLIRLLKVIRRVHLLESLNLMVFGIVSCVAPLFWAICILILIMYAFGVFFMSGLTSEMQKMEYPLPDDDAIAQIENLDTGFGSVYRTIASLFEAVTGGNDWAGIAEDMRAVSEGLYVCFALYVVFVTLGVLNIVTGFFVDGTMQANVNAREEMLKQAQEKKNTMIQLVGELFTQLDTDQSGKLSFEELDSHLHDEALQEYFCVLEMEPEEAKDLFCLLDIRGEGEVSITDFTNGCLKIMGAPKNLDICTCLYQSRRMIILLENISACITGKKGRS